MFKIKEDDGYYALCEGRKLINPSEKCILSEEISTEIELGISFWYFMYGNDIGTLELILYEKNEDNQLSTTINHVITTSIQTTTPIVNNKKVIWSLSGKQKREWLLANITLPIGNYTVTKSNQIFKLKLLFNILKLKLEFSGNLSTSNRFQADIAIDDLNIEGNERN